MSADTIQKTDETANKMNIEEFMESLTGYDLIAVEKSFGTDIHTLFDTKPLMGFRAAAFVLRRRELTTPHTKQAAVDRDAHEHVMGMTQGAVHGLFHLDEDDETGEGDSQPG